MLKEIREDTLKGKIFCVHGFKDLILLRWQHYPKILIQYLSKFQWHFFFAEIENLSKIYMGLQGTPYNQNNPEKEEQSWNAYVPWF